MKYSLYEDFLFIVFTSISFLYKKKKIVQKDTHIKVYPNTLSYKS